MIRSLKRVLKRVAATIVRYVWGRIRAFPGWLVGTPARKILVIFAGSMTLLVGVCSGGLLMWVNFTTHDAALEADKFLTMLEYGEYAEAYASTSKRFRAQQDLETMIEYTSYLDLAYSDLDPWRDRSLEYEGRTQVRGTIEDRLGPDTRFAVEMTFEDGQWRVLALNGPRRIGVGPGAWFRRLPPSEEWSQKLVKQTMLEFGKAVRGGDFTEFYDNMSIAFHGEVPLFGLQRAFQHYIDDKVDFSGAADVDAITDDQLRRGGFGGGSDGGGGGNGGGDSVGAGGMGGGGLEGAPGISRGQLDVLVISGFFPAAPLPLPFTFRYVYQHPEWKLYKLNVRPPGVDALYLEQCVFWLLGQRSLSLDQCEKTLSKTEYEKRRGS